MRRFLRRLIVLVAAFLFTTSPLYAQGTLWHVVSSRLSYDAGGGSNSSADATDMLSFGRNGIWRSVHGQGTFRIERISPADWPRWRIAAYGPTLKVVLNGWKGRTVDGPIETSGKQITFFWLVYHVGPPVTTSPATIFVKFGRTSGTLPSATAQPSAGPNAAALPQSETPATFSGSYYHMEGSTVNEWDFHANGTFLHRFVCAGATSTSQRGRYRISNGMLFFQVTSSASGYEGPHSIGGGTGGTGPVQRCPIELLGSGGSAGLLLNNVRYSPRHGW